MYMQRTWRVTVAQNAKRNFIRRSRNVYYSFNYFHIRHNFKFNNQWCMSHMAFLIRLMTMFYYGYSQHACPSLQSRPYCWRWEWPWVCFRIKNNFIIYGAIQLTYFVKVRVSKGFVMCSLTGLLFHWKHKWCTQD